MKPWFWINCFSIDTHRMQMQLMIIRFNDLRVKFSASSGCFQQEIFQGICSLTISFLRRFGWKVFWREAKVARKQRQCSKIREVAKPRLFYPDFNSPSKKTLKAKAIDKKGSASERQRNQTTFLRPCISSKPPRLLWPPQQKSRSRLCFHG